MEEGYNNSYVAFFIKRNLDELKEHIKTGGDIPSDDYTFFCSDCAYNNLIYLDACKNCKHDSIVYTAECYGKFGQVLR